MTWNSHLEKSLLMCIFCSQPEHKQHESREVRRSDIGDGWGLTWQSSKWCQMVDEFFAVVDCLFVGLQTRRIPLSELNLMLYVHVLIKVTDIFWFWICLFFLVALHLDLPPLSWPNNIITVHIGDALCCTFDGNLSVDCSCNQPSLQPTSLPQGRQT